MRTDCSEVFDSRRRSSFMTRCVWRSGDNCGIHAGLFSKLLRISLACYQIVSVFVLVVATHSSNAKDDATFYHCIPIGHPLDFTLIVNWRDGQRRRLWNIVCACRSQRQRYLVHFSKALSLNCEAHHLSLHHILIEILTMHPPVPECSESEDDEVDNELPLIVFRRDNGRYSRETLHLRQVYHDV